MKINATAFSAVAAIGAAFGNELFPAKAHTAVAAVACFNPDLCFINKHLLSRYKKRMAKNHPSFTRSEKFLLDYMDFSTIKLNRSISDCEQSIILAHSDIGAGKE